MLRAAPALRQSYDEYIQKNIFINADLSPAAAKLAYESRKKRRENQTRRAVRAIDANHMHTGNAVSHLNERSSNADQPTHNECYIQSTDSVGPASSIAAVMSPDRSSALNQPSTATLSVVDASHTVSSAASTAAAAAEPDDAGSQHTSHDQLAPFQ